MKIKKYIYNLKESEMGKSVLQGLEQVCVIWMGNNIVDAGNNIKFRYNSYTEVGLYDCLSMQ